MASEKTDAITIRIVDFSESSCIATLFTRDFGKIGAMVKGARRPKSSFESAIDLLTISRIVFIHKSSDSLDLLTEAKLQRRFRAATRSLPHLYAGYYIAELLDTLTQTGDPHPDLFELARETLIQLDELQDPLSLVIRFELNLLRMIGQKPSFEKCTLCGGEISQQPRVSFGQLSGGVLCGKCRVGQSRVISMSWGVLEAMNLFSVCDTALPEVDPLVLGELRGVLNNYMANMMGRRPRMQKLLGMLGRPATIRDDALSLLRKTETRVSLMKDTTTTDDTDKDVLNDSTFSRNN
ncbi:MAG: DNA repair protein RecO [Planctomycetaceae bacterium]|nr:DNA repair protein RecO [Planctomycetaceae bacterium]|tara:strand:+ start:8831 stop:9712 length:882 start_codon:yes stop_codon:yes gene_type:complete